jgi:hypothetical protein
MAAITLPEQTIAGAAHRQKALSSIAAAIRVRCVSLFGTALNAREHYLSQACDQAAFAVRERAWKAYEDSLATMSRVC